MNLNEYAAEHGATEKAFLNYGWQKTQYKGLDAIAFSTNSGTRYRMLEGEIKYISENGYKRCWYKLDEALALVSKTEHPLILCNGEASVTAAHYYEVPATCVTAGEKKNIPDDLVAELVQRYPSKTIFLAFDCDKTGRLTAKGIAEQLTKAGLFPIVLHFDKFETKPEGYDLADWLKDTRPTQASEIQSLIYVDTADIEDDIEEKTEGSKDTREAIEQIARNFPWQSFIEGEFGYCQLENNGEIRVLGNGGLLVNPEKGKWICFRDEVGGGVVELVQYALYGDKYDKQDKKGQWKEALHKAALLAHVELPKLTDKKTTQTKLKESEAIRLALQELGYTFQVNAMSDVLEVNGEAITDYVRAKILTELNDLGFKKVGVNENAIATFAFGNEYHPIKDYLNSLKWDGQDYIRQVANHLIGAAEDDAVYIFFKRWLIGAVAKVLDNKQNVMLVLEGPQGKGKSTFCQWLASGVHPQYFIKKAVKPEDKDSYIRLMTKWIWEVEELGHTTRRADVDALKSFITDDWVTVRKAYGRYDTNKAAVASLIGTVNHDGAGFLVDTTGNRRFMIAAIVDIDFNYTHIDVNQLWAQAVALYRAGEPWSLTKEERELQAAINEEYQVPDPIKDAILTNFDIGDPTDFVPTALVNELVKASGISYASEKGLSMDVARTLTSMGLKKARLGTERIRGYFGLKMREEGSKMREVSSKGFKPY